MTGGAASLSSIPWVIIGFGNYRELNMQGTNYDLLVSSRTDCHQAASITEYLVGQVLFATGLPVTPAARLSGIQSSQGVSSS